MMTEMDIAELALKVAQKELGSAEVESAEAEPVVDSWGDDAVRITIVVAAGALDRVSDDAVLDTLVGIRRAFEKRGEDRMPIMSYATRDELDLVGDS